MIAAARMAPKIIIQAALVLMVLLIAGGPAASAMNHGFAQRKLAVYPGDMPLDSDVFRVPAGYNAPQQVHITQGDRIGEAVYISWITPSAPEPKAVVYGLQSGNYSNSKESDVLRYTYYNYTSGFIHHARIDNLKPNTKYYYKLGNGTSAREFSFTTPPPVGPDVPYTFGIIADLGQTFDSNRTLDHYVRQGKGQTVLLVGDFSYADTYPFHDNNRWDTWGRFIERSAAYQPWIWVAGNHEIDFLPEVGEVNTHKPYLNRFRVPYKSSNSTSPLWYSIKRASAHIIVLNSYSAYGKYTPQYVWLQKELASVDRKQTPWLIVLFHSPWYNSNLKDHYMEGETMRVQFEAWFVKAKVDIVFSGHVHAYERTYRISNIDYNITNGLCTPQLNPSAPIYVVVGDGGADGLSPEYTPPQPAYSARREASFGYATLDIKNRTHAYYSWYRNQDAVGVANDSLWLSNLYWTS